MNDLSGSLDTPSDAPGETRDEGSPPPPALPRARRVNPPGSFVAALLHPIVSIICLMAIILGAVILPPSGVGFSTCTFQSSTGMPCPGCGLTRSVTSFLQGQWLAGWQYHPFGAGFALFFILLGPLVFLPRRWRARLVELATPYERWIIGVLVVFMFAMMGHGVVRAVQVKSGAEGSTWWRDSGVPPALQECCPADNPQITGHAHTSIEISGDHSAE